MEYYSIYRFYQYSERELIAEGLTLEEAKEHCSNPDTHGKRPHKLKNWELWFDGYVQE